MHLLTGRTRINTQAGISKKQYFPLYLEDSVSNNTAFQTGPSSECSNPDALWVSSETCLTKDIISHPPWKPQGIVRWNSRSTCKWGRCTMPSGKLNQRESGNQEKWESTDKWNCKTGLFKNEESVLHSSAGTQKSRDCTIYVLNPDRRD